MSFIFQTFVTLKHLYEHYYKSMHLPFTKLPLLINTKAFSYRTIFCYVLSSLSFFSTFSVLSLNLIYFNQ